MNCLFMRMPFNPQENYRPQFQKAGGCNTGRPSISTDLHLPHRGVATAALVAERFDCKYLEIKSAHAPNVSSPIVDVIGNGDGVVGSERRPAPVAEILPEG